MLWSCSKVLHLRFVHGLRSTKRRPNSNFNDWWHLLLLPSIFVGVLYINLTESGEYYIVHYDYSWWFLVPLNEFSSHYSVWSLRSLRDFFFNYIHSIYFSLTSKWLESLCISYIYYYRFFFFIFCHSLELTVVSQFLFDHWL